MRARASSLHEMLWPDSEAEFATIASAWTDEMILQMLGLVWDGFDQMKAQHFQGIDFSQRIEQLERGLTDLHMDEISLLWKQRRDGFESFIPKHEAWEFRSRKDASAMPPSTDIGFVLVANRSLRWSVEAKVLEHPADVTRYLADLTDKYLTGRGSPLSLEAALAGYLRTGLPDETFLHLQARLGQPLKTSMAFPNRSHRVSRHQRRLAGRREKVPFACHHLILDLTNR